ncbi:hypothetical protein Tco_0605495 [Tanacetum coccineum]
MALRHATSFLELCSLVKVDIEKGEVTNISVKDLSWTLTQTFRGRSWVGRISPVVKTAVPVDGRFEHMVLSCHVLTDHSIALMEREF